MDMQSAKLGATVQLRKDFARIEQTVRIKRAFQALLVGQITLIEHGAHQVTLFDPDPVLARQNPPASTQSLRMSAPKASARSTSAGLLAS